MLQAMLLHAQFVSFSAEVGAGSPAGAAAGVRLTLSHTDPVTRMHGKKSVRVGSPGACVHAMAACLFWHECHAHECHAHALGPAEASAAAATAATQLLMQELFASELKTERYPEN